jgi:virginiamycin B lyase
MRWSILLLAFPFALAVPPQAEAAEVRIQEWQVPWDNTRPRDPYLGPDGKVWFVGQAGNYVAVFDPETEDFERFELPEGTRPHTVVVAEDGHPWIAGNGNGTIVEFDPGSGEFTIHEVPDTNGLQAKDPHTFDFDGHGGIWFTLQRGNGIGRIDMASGDVRIAVVPTRDALPYGLVCDSKGRPWAVMLGSNKLVTVDPESFELREIDLPRPDTRMRRLGIDGDGRIWYADYLNGYLGVYDPDSGQTREWKTPSERSGPYAMTVDAQGRSWIFETYPNPNLLQGFDPQRGEWLNATAVPSGGGTVRHMVFDPATNSLWFGTDTNNLGRAELP